MEIEENRAQHREKDVRIFEGFQDSPERVPVGSAFGRQIQQKNDERKGEKHVDQQRDQVGDHIVEDRQKDRDADIGNIPVKAAETVDDQRGLPHAEEYPVDKEEQQKNRTFKKQHREREPDVENITDV